MFGSTILDVAIGVIFVFILVSVICSAIREGIESLLKTRAAHLEHGIRELLHDRSGTGLARDLFQHPMVAALYENDYDTARPARDGRKRPWALARGGKMPSYIPSRSFAVALMDLAVRGREITPENSSAGAPVITLESLRDGVSNLQNEKVQRALLVAIDSAQGDLDRAQANLEAWYESGMDRVSGWYKRSTHRVLFVIGLTLAIVLNIDTIAIADHLYRDDAAREVLVARAIAAARADSAARAGRQSTASVGTAPVQAPGTTSADSTLVNVPVLNSDSAAVQATTTDTARRAGAMVGVARIDTARGSGASTAGQDTSEYGRAMRALDSLPIPLGWGARRAQLRHVECDPGLPCFVQRGWVHGMLPLFGWLLTALAATLGAPFWFDVLNKVMVIRSTVKPHEKSGEEGSEDRKNDRKPAMASGGTLPAVPSGAVAALPAGATAALPVGAAAAGGIAAAAGAAHDPSEDLDGCGGGAEVVTMDEDLPLAHGGVE